MLEPWALRHHALKKRIAWRIYQKRTLDDARALHVTSDLEAKNVRSLGLRSEIVCIPNGLDVPLCCPVRSSNRQKRALFLGRLHPIKGLPMLLQAWARINPVDWSLDIAGPDESSHRRALEAAVQRLGLDQVVTFCGPVSSDAKASLMQRASLFVLPSHSESFGVAAGEALAMALPVVATKGTPWTALERERCGWHVETSVDGLEAGLRAAFGTGLASLDERGKRGYLFVAQEFSWPKVAADMTALYRRILDKGRVA